MDGSEKLASQASAEPSWVHSETIDVHDCAQSAISDETNERFTIEGTEKGHVEPLNVLRFFQKRRDLLEADQVCLHPVGRAL